MDVKKQCANSTRTGCDGFVLQKGNILCENCIEARKAQLKLRKEQSMDELLERNKDMENQLYKLKQEHADTISKYEDTIRNLVDEKSEIDQKQLDQYKEDAIRLEEEFNKKLKEHELNHQLLLSRQQTLENDNQLLNEKIKELNNIIIEKNQRLQEIQNELSSINTSLKTENTRLLALHEKYKEYNAKLEKENSSLSELNRKLQIENEMLLQEKEKLHLEESQVKLDSEQILLDNKRLTDINNQLINQNELLTKENEALTKAEDPPAPVERVNSRDRGSSVEDKILVRVNSLNRERVSSPREEKGLERVNSLNRETRVSSVGERSRPSKQAMTTTVTDRKPRIDPLRKKT